MAEEKYPRHVFTVRVETVSNRVRLLEGVLLRRRGSWRYFRRPDMPEFVVDQYRGWKENGTRRVGWYDSPEAALRVFIDSLFSMRSREAKLLRGIFPDFPTEEQEFRQLVDACVMLAKLWARQQAT